MEQIAKLQRKLKILEEKKLKLLKQEMRSSARLKYKSQVLGFYLDELEAMYMTEARKRELEITKLYSRFNNYIARKIKHGEGDLEVV
jgi:hypothetical protein